MASLAIVVLAIVGRSAPLEALPLATVVLEEVVVVEALQKELIGW